MNINDFTCLKAGKLVDTAYGVKAFIPASLPPEIDMGELAMPLAEAMQCVGELKGASRRLANPYILVKPLQRREALTSSAMEGTFSTGDQLALAEMGLESQADQQTKEVRNYLTALQVSLDALQTKNLPISHRMLKDAHRILLSHVGRMRGSNKRPGEYKTEQNAIGGDRIETARFVPVPPGQTLACMDDLEKFINREIEDENKVGQSLIDIALAHYQLETIHPFADGNGRVGRMLISLMAVERELFDMPLLYVSPAIEKNKDEYIDLMYNVSAKGEWEKWIKFFLSAVADTAKSTIGTIDKLIALQEEYRGLVSEATRTSNAITVVDFLFEKPIVDIPEVRDLLNVTYRSASQIVQKLVDLGILIELPGFRPKVFVARTILDISI